jgi:DnaK suppressor protein
VTAKQRVEIKNKIIEDINHLSQEIATLREKTAPIAPDCSLGILLREEMIIAQQVYLHALHESEIRLNKLKYALQNVDDTEYGICLECEEEIAFARLELLPESTHCVTCKSELGL